jgi:hypothetical protein
MLSGFLFPFFTFQDFSLNLIIPYKFDITREIVIAVNAKKFVLKNQIYS